MRQPQKQQPMRNDNIAVVPAANGLIGGVMVSGVQHPPDRRGGGRYGRMWGVENELQISKGNTCGLMGARGFHVINSGRHLDPFAVSQSS